jgi:hypothetical protein
MSIILESASAGLRWRLSRAAFAVRTEVMERLMKSITDSGKVKIGGGGITLIKPVKKTKKKT